MTAAQLSPDVRREVLDAIRRYVQLVAPTLRLSQWEITIEDTPPQEPDRVAEVTRTVATWHAFISFHDNFFLTETPESRRIIIVHELLHLHLMDTAALVADLSKRLGGVGESVYDERYAHTSEMAIDALSRALSPLLPPFAINASELAAWRRAQGGTR